MSVEPADALRAAAWAGTHALAIFAVLLAVVVGAAALLFEWGARHVARHAAVGGAPPRVLLPRLALALLIVIGGAAVFAEVAAELGGSAAWMGAADQALADALAQSVPAAALLGFVAITHLADTATLTALCIGVAVLLVARGRRWLAVGWVAAVGGNAILNTTLKGLFARVRPVHTGGPASAEGFSFPSGHSSGSVVAYCMLAYLALRLLPPRWHRPAALVAVALAFSIGASRIFLRVHFASDVLAGFVSGTVWLTVCIVTIEMARRWRGPRR